MENRNLIKGIITEYNSERGFGFITEIDEDFSYFFHISNVIGKIKIVPNKTEVVFKPVDTAKGPQATNIKVNFEKIEGEFARVELPNNTNLKTNSEKIEYLEQQQEVIHNVLDALNKFGISVKEDRSGWINLDLYEMEELNNPIVVGGHHKKVPNGYPKTFEHLMRLLQNQINDFNYDLINVKKGLKGEQKTLESLKAITVSYPILNNVRLEEDIKNSSEKYSAETDLIIVTDRAIFLVETKNYGGKGDTLIITTDGRWILRDKYDKKEKTIKSPFKQTTDHIFVINKFLENNSIKFNLPIIPIVALANDDLILQIEDKESLYAKVISADLVGSYILNYLNENIPRIKEKDIEAFKKLLDSKSLPQKSYKVLNYCENILVICEAISKLLKYYQHDMNILIKTEKEKEEKELAIKREKEEQERIEREEQERTDRILEGIGTVIGLVGSLLDL